MKKLMLILPVAAIGFTGCVVYQPSPSSGQYGYTYDYQVPISEGVPSPAFSSITTPRRTSFASTSASTPVVADEVPAPPTTPPIVSSIPEMTPRPIIQNRTTTMVYPQPQQIREAAGAQPGQATAAAPVVGYPGTTVVSDGGFPFVTSITNTNRPPTNGIPTNGIPTNGIPTNGIPTNGIPTNGVPIPAPTNGTFNPPGSGVDEPAGAPAQQLEPANQLPAAPRLQQGQTPQSAPSPNTTIGGQPGQAPFSAGAAAPAQSRQQSAVAAPKVPVSGGVATPAPAAPAAAPAAAAPAPAAPAPAQP